MIDRLSKNTFSFLRGNLKNTENLIGIRRNVALLTVLNAYFVKKTARGRNRAQYGGFTKRVTGIRHRRGDQPPICSSRPASSTMVLNWFMEVVRYSVKSALFMKSRS